MTTTLEVGNPTTIDHANRTNNGKIMKITELLEQSNGVLTDATMLEGNDGDGNKSAVRTGIPQGTWRKLYGGVDDEKSTTAEIRDAAGMLESYATIDRKLYTKNGQSKEWRLSEEKPFISGMSQTVATTLFYGDQSIDDEKFTGLAPRFSDLSAENAENILVGGGAGADNTSIWLIGWGPTATHLFYPEGSEVGLSVKDLGEVTERDANNKKFQAMQTHYKWDVGLAVRNWQFIVRIPNIDVSDLTKDASAGADIINLMMRATELMPEDMEGVRPIFYCNRTIRSFLRQQMQQFKNTNLTFDTVEGHRVLAFDEFVVRRTDAILNSEALVV